MEALKKGQGSGSFKVCLVCGDKAIARNYGAVSCPSCKAFFRRNALRELWGRCYGGCMITVATRNFCKHCRLRKCLSVGMRPELILDDKQKMERKMKLMERKHTMAKVSENSVNETHQQDMQTSSVRYQSEQSYGYQPNGNDMPPNGDHFPSLDPLGITGEKSQGSFHVVPQINHPMPHQGEPMEQQNSSNIDFDMLDQGRNLDTNVPYQGVPMFQDNYSRDQTLSVGSSSTSGSSPSGSTANPLSPFPTMKGVNSPPITSIVQNPMKATIKTENPSLSPNMDGSYQSGSGGTMMDTSNGSSENQNIGTTQEEKDKKGKKTKEGLLKIKLPERMSFQLESVIKNGHFSEDMKNNMKELASAYEASYDYYLPVDINTSPSPLEFINMADKSVRRLVKFAKRLHHFRQLEQDDQISLLKGCVVEVMILRSVLFVDTENKGWKVDHANNLTGLGTAHISAESLDEDPVGHNMKTMFQEYMMFVKGLMEVLQYDDLVLLCMTAMSIFAEDRPGLKKRDSVTSLYKFYSNMLQTYLDITYPKGRIKFEDLQQKLQEIRRLNDVVSNLMMKERVENIEPLMVEMFNLTS